MIYLNNAATTYPKPSCVLEAFMECAGGVPAGQMRSSYETEPGDVLDECRRSMAGLLGVGDWKRIFFTSGATEASNLFIRGMDWTGKRVLVAQTEHNSILRPVMNHPDLKGRVTVLPCDDKGYIAPCLVEEASGEGPGVLIVSHCSNVTGTIQPMEELARAAKQKGYLLAVDVSQSAGCIPVEGDRWGADILIFTGHKSLMGLQGTGGIYIRAGLDIRPLKYGGTGRDSAKLVYGTDPGQYEYEPGTQNIAGIAALKAGADYVAGLGVEAIRRREAQQCSWLYEQLASIRGVRLFGPEQAWQRGPVLSFNIEGLAAADTAYILNNSYGIIVRAGLHCAPLIHDGIGSGKHGTVRASISCETRREELVSFVDAVREICGSLMR